MSTTKIVDEAYSVIKSNDKGLYTIPTDGLYPFQWNWDSCLSALGIFYYDEKRAWQEIEGLFEHQWADGMVPHIIFRQKDERYFPGPEIWETGTNPPTSGITQPPVAGFIVQELFNRAKDKQLAIQKANILIPKISKWHQWFFEYRDPQKQGLVGLVHPWESGRDNSIDWDLPLSSIKFELADLMSYQRRDTTHTNPAHRPTRKEYDSYIWLIQKFKDLKWDNKKIYEDSPFKVIDPGFNGILAHSCEKLADLAHELGNKKLAQKEYANAASVVKSLESLWSESHKQYLCKDQITDQLIDSPSIAGIIAVIGSQTHADKIASRIEDIKQNCTYIVPSHEPTSIDFDGVRYWRGPIWLIANYLIGKGLKKAGYAKLAANIYEDSVKLIKKSGFFEYYDPKTAEGCGGKNFTWTAAMIIEFLTKNR